MTLIPVALAIFYQKIGPNHFKVWIQERTDGALKGQWEFPGGKLEPGETPHEALIREIYEEVAIDISQSEVFFLGVFPVDYADKRILLNSFILPWHEGLNGKEDTFFIKDKIAQIKPQTPLLPANRELIEYLIQYLYSP